MSILFSLIIITCAIFWFQIKIWKVEKNIVFPIFTAIFYFWSLAGCWLFSFDKLTGFGKKIGLQYYYLLEKMFYVHFDAVYLQAIWMYGLFILFFQIFIWIGLTQLKKWPKNQGKTMPIYLNPSVFMLMAIFFLFVSFWIIKDVIIYSLLLNESVYINIRSASINGYTLHQYACWIMIVSLFMYVGLYLKQKKESLQVQKPGFFFWSIFAICNLYLVLIGSRHETFFGGILVLILMSYPFRSLRLNKKLYVIVIAVWFFILMLNDPIRSLMPVIASKSGLTSMLSTKEKLKEAVLYSSDRTFVSHKSPQKSAEIIAANAMKDTVVFLKYDTLVMNKDLFMSQLQKHPSYVLIDNKKMKIVNSHISMAYQDISFFTKITLTLTNMIFSNELFAGHFSMYGVLNKDVSPKFGFSFKNLLYSFVPSSSDENRPLDAYSYYAQEMKFKEGQGFTINYITAWYLNFSYFGLILGPLFLTLILLLPFYLSTKSQSNFYQLFALIALCGITGFGAMMVRSGPESFKALLYESVIIPIFIVAMSIFVNKMIIQLKSKNAR